VTKQMSIFDEIIRVLRDPFSSSALPGLAADGAARLAPPGAWRPRYASRFRLGIKDQLRGLSALSVFSGLSALKAATLLGMTNHHASDTEYLAERRFAEERAYLINTSDPAIAPKLSPAVLALRALLAEAHPRYVPWDSAMAEMVRKSEIAVRTAENLLRKFIAHGFVDRRGEYSRTYAKRTRKWSVTDSRAVRLGEWPTEHDPA
jgi:hypothetical protein